MTRSLLTAGLLLATACASGSSGVASGVAPVATERPAIALLAAEDARSLLDARAAEFTRRVALMAGDLTDAELERLVPASREAMGREALEAKVAAFLEGADSTGSIDGMLRVHDAGSIGELVRTRDAYRPSRSLADFAGSLVDSPPDPERLEAVIDWVDARGSGSFFMLMDQALDEAGHTVWRAFRPGAPSFVPLRGQELFEMLDASTEAAVVTALYRLETVPTEVIVAATAEMRSAPGRWFVEHYPLAVATAIREASIEVAAAVR